MQYSSIFYEQSYADALADYERAMNSNSIAKWDYIILTASNEHQAAGYEAQLRERRFPTGTKTVVISDPDGKRVGSGGATLNVLKYIREHEPSFENLRILVIHSGGDSKRVPQYSAVGKLFSPVPHVLPDGRSSTLFDEFMISMASVPSRIRAGMLLLSGDVLLLFNPLQIDFTGDAAAISFKENVDTGKNHGVYLRGDNGYVAKCLQKQSVEKLRSVGAVNEQDCVDIDTGAVLFSPSVLTSLYSLATPEFINDHVRLSLYADFLYPLASDSTLDQFYLEKPEGEYSPELDACRRAVWEKLRPYRMKLLRLAPAKFIHFGTTREVLKLMTSEVDEYSYLGWNRNTSSSAQNCAGYCSVSVTKTIGEGVYLEVSHVHAEAKIGNQVILSYVDIHDETIPDRVVLHGLKLLDGRFCVRIYGVDDNPKGQKLFGIDIGETLWNAKLYPVCGTIKEGIKSALNLYADMHGQSDSIRYDNAERLSLSDGFNQADPDVLIAWQKRMSELVQMEQLAQAIESGTAISKVKLRPAMSDTQHEWLRERLAHCDYSMRMRLLYYIGKLTENEEMVSQAFHTIQQTVISQVELKENLDARIVKDFHQVNLPLRVNWGGGWSDTPPYCLENGGTVLNAAILLNRQKPVQVKLERLEEIKVIFESRDMDVYGEFTEIASLQSVGDPYDPFVLQKAALLACGIIPQTGGDLQAILKRLGGGFIMHSEVTNVPKGSGLGTSSILAGACVKALFEFFGIAYDEASLYSHVSVMEQIMSTGGGWQDQVGGLSEGVKYISTLPGIKQEIRAQHIDIPQKAWEELKERFALIYTGQRRLARNLLRDVVGRYIGNEPDCLYALNEIQRVAALMRFELERGHIDDFAKLLEEHWKLSQMIDEGSTNTLIDQIFSVVDDFVDGRLVCGAGGGGFLQVILKKGVTHEQVHNRLKEVFQDSEVDIFDAELI